MKFFRIASLLYFEKYWSIFNQIGKIWMLSKFIQKELLRNVQERISRFLGEWENQNTKVATVLRDTLCKQIFLSGGED